MSEFTGPDDFVEALSGSHIIRRPKSLLYLQSLKLLQTSLERRPAGEGCGVAALAARAVIRPRRQLSAGSRRARVRRAQDFPAAQKGPDKEGDRWDNRTRSTTST